MRLLLLLLCVNLGGILSKTLPPEISKCSLSDPNFNRCLDASGTAASKLLKDGNRAIGVAPLEPFIIDKVDLGNTTSGAVSLHQVYRNMRLFGMTDSIVSGSEANFTGDNCYWNYNTFTPSVRMESDYTMKGRMLLFHINGHGKCTNHLYEIEGKYGAKCERYKKKNKTFIRVTEFSFEMKPKRLLLDFENLFDGNEQLSKEIVKTLNENIESVYADVGPSFNEVLGTVWKQTLNQVFSKVPEDELFLP